jgi:hypothetical protein
MKAVICAALAVAITVLTTQGVVQLAALPRASAAHGVLIAQSDSCAHTA